MTTNSLTKIGCIKTETGRLDRRLLYALRGAVCVAVLASMLAGNVAAEQSAATLNDLARESTMSARARWSVPDFFFGRTQEDALKPNWAHRLTGYLKTRDGVDLRYSVLLPPGKGPFPVLLNYSGYDPGAIGGYSYLHSDTAMANGVDQSLLKHGYAVLGVNARGTGCSEGSFDFLGPTYGADGADIVEWAASQSWSSGAVGMVDWSWAAMSQVATASERPPHLKAIAPGMAMTDPRLDSWAIGGVSSPGFVTGWWMFLHSRWLAVRGSAEAEHDQRCLVQVETNYASGQTTAINLPSLLIRHPLRDDWMERETTLYRADRIDVPVLSMEAFQDEATTARAGYYQERLDPRKLWYVQTNGNHDLYESLEFRPILLAFFDHFVKGIDNGFEKRPHVEIWEETTSQPGSAAHVHDEQAKSGWIITRDQYPAAVDELTFTLSSGGRLSTDSIGISAPSGASPSDSYHYPVPGPVVDTNPYAPAWGPQPTEWREGSVSYTSAPLLKDIVIYGPVSANLWVSSNSSDTDLQVTLSEIRPDGQEQFVQRGWLRMSNRALDATRSTPTRPWPCDSLTCVQALTPGVPALGRVELTKVSHAFRSGSRMRIWIDTPSAMGGNSFFYSPHPSINQIWHDPEHPSSITVGVLRDVAVPKLAVACGAALMQPCRPDPLAK